MTGARVVTFGRQPTEQPKFTFTEVHFPQLARLDEGTSEGMISRVLTSLGGDTRSLPRTIYFQDHQAPGHDESVAVGSLHEVTIDGETGILSGKGWLMDSDYGRNAAMNIASKTLFHNSVDLSELKVEFEEHGDFWDDDFWVEVKFVEWKLAATTLVGKPAFADAHAVIPDELTAAIAAGPLVCETPEQRIRIMVEASDEEVMASATGVPSWDMFHRPESTDAHKIIVGEPDDDGWIPVYGHLGLWNSCHDGIEGQCTVIPRPHDNYASFNKPSVLTDRGQVEAGPISLYGGHIPLHKAADDPANAWCDVRVVAGVHGPWLSGVVRPGIALDDAKVYVARASRISGHWKSGRLKMIVSCNAEGFDVPGSGFSFATNSKGEVTELVASFPGCSESLGRAREETFHEVQEGHWLGKLELSNPGAAAELAKVIAAQSSTMAAGQSSTTTTVTFDSSIEDLSAITDIGDEDIDDDIFDVDIERARRERRLRLNRS